jgi:tetratricopeptide (TPR) repeat protein
MALTPPVPPPVAEIEKHLRWRLLPTVLFIVALSSLAALAFFSLAMPHQHPRGLPDDPQVLAAAAGVAGRVTVRTNTLRWSTALLGGEPANVAPTAAMLALVDSARARLHGARHRGDPRVLAARAALDLAAHDYPRAATQYRRACELAPHFAEARLGAGVALALEADRTPELWQARALRLEAIAQFAMVDSLDDEYALALYDRAMVLRDVGRESEARYWAARFAAHAPPSDWTRTLEKEGFAQ